MIWGENPLFSETSIEIYIYIYICIYIDQFLLLQWCFCVCPLKNPNQGESEAVEGGFARKKIEGLVRMLDVEVTSKLMPPKILGIFG